MALTPPPFLGTNEVVCVPVHLPVCVEGYNCFFFSDTPILLSEGVCVPCPLNGSGRRRSPHVLLKTTTLSLQGWNGVTPVFCVEGHNKHRIIWLHSEWVQMRMG